MYPHVSILRPRGLVAEMTFCDVRQDLHPRHHQGKNDRHESQQPPSAAPASIDGTAGMADSGRDELAGRSTRFAAAMVDGLLVCAILVPISIATGYNDRNEADQFLFLEEVAMLMLGRPPFPPEAPLRLDSQALKSPPLRELGSTRNYPPSRESRP